ncbi:MAG: aminotransferase [Desulfobacterales bacterium]|nr:MAG: aminotransferase [Desulfobacterales bacterium]
MKQAQGRGSRAYTTDELIQQDKAHVVHPWATFEIFDKQGALPIAKAEGCYVYDSDGNRYLDAVGGLWCTNIGTGREEMAQAIAAQVRTMVYANPFVDMTNIPATRLATKLAELTPGTLNRVIYTSGGSTAIDSALRLIHYYQNCRGRHAKKHIISRRDAYHGSTYAAMSLGGRKGDHPPEFEYITDTIHHISAPNVYRRPAGMEDLTESALVNALVKEFEDKIAALGGADKVAAFFAEPVMGAGGVIVPPEGYLRRMWEVCQERDILFVSDEVVTAFGRLGHWFVSQDVFGIQPDIITCAKGLTSGYQPLGAAIFADEIYDVISAEGHKRYFAHGFTYCGHPVACAAALKNIEILEREKILDHVREVGPYFEKRLKTLSDLPIVGDVRGSHLMMCVEFVADKETKKRFPDAVDIGKVVSNQADARGLIVRPVGNLNVMSPALVITAEQIDHIVGTLRESIEAATSELQKKGLLKNQS